MRTPTSVRLSRRFSLQHDGAELARRIERAQLLTEEPREDPCGCYVEYEPGGDGVYRHLILCDAHDAQELAEGTDYDDEARSYIYRGIE